MPDITMCTGEQCPMRESCYRYLAESDGESQTFFSHAPFKLSDEEEASCSFYWEFGDD